MFDSFWAAYREGVARDDDRALVPLYDFRLEDLRQWHIVEGHCGHCFRVERVRDDALLRADAPYVRLVRLSLKLKCFACGKAGCASSADRIASTYVSPLQYQNYTCDQATAEMTRVSRRATELQGTLAKTDTAQMAIGMLIFWPALFFLEGGNGPETAEYARLKGEKEALEQIAIQKNCAVAIMPAIATTRTP